MFRLKLTIFEFHLGSLWALQPLAPDLALKCGSTRPEVAHCFGCPWRFRLLARMITSVLSFVESSSLTQNSLLRIWLCKTRLDVQRLSAVQTDHEYHPPSAPNLNQLPAHSSEHSSHQKNNLWQALTAARTEHRKWLQAHQEIRPATGRTRLCLSINIPSLIRVELRFLCTYGVINILIQVFGI
jgi:hypothetical protein